MNTLLRRSIPIMMALATLGAHAQYLKNHKATLSAGGSGQFDTILTSGQTGTNAFAPFPGGGTYPVTVANEQQFTTNSAGLVTSLQLDPVSWAGVEFNYGFTHYQERYTFNYTNTTTPAALQQTRIPVDAHEATGAYIIHAHHIPLQPFVGIGGGAIDFVPRTASNQWRGAALMEVGFDMPVRWTHVGFRVEGRSLYYRSPNFYQPAISTRTWRVTSEPVLSAFYRF
jgi:hypothetical protein